MGPVQLVVCGCRYVCVCVCVLVLVCVCFWAQEIRTQVGDCYIVRFVMDFAE